MKRQKIINCCAAVLFAFSVLMMPWGRKGQGAAPNTGLTLLPPLYFVRELFESEAQFVALEEARQPHREQNEKEVAVSIGQGETEPEQAQTEEKTPAVKVKLKFKFVEWLKNLF